MSISFILFKKLIIMFIYMLIGYIMTKHKIISKKISEILSNFLLYIVFPIAVINSFLIKKTEANFSLLKESLIITIIALLISMIISYIVYGKRKSVENISVAFSSAGFMGIPIIASVFGQKAVFYGAFFAAILTFLQWTYGVYLITGNKKYVKLGKIVLNPIFLSIVIGFLIYNFNVEVPRNIEATFSLISTINGPLVMIIIGGYLLNTNLKNMLFDKDCYKASLFRLFIIPLATLLVLSLLPISREVKLINMIAVSAPVGSNIAIFAKMYKCDYIKAVNLVCFTTIACFITMPIIIFISEFIIK